MEHIKTHKINPVHMCPGDTFGLHYSYEEPEGQWNSRYLNVESVDEYMVIDTVIVYKTDAGEFGLKAGRVLVMGEDDSTHAGVPVSEGMKVLSGGRVQK